MAAIESLTMGDVTADLSTFMGAVIDERAVRPAPRRSTRARSAAAAQRADRRHVDDSRRATSSARRWSSATDPTDEVFTTEYFGPILGVHVFDDADYERRAQRRPPTSRRTR